MALKNFPNWRNPSHHMDVNEAIPCARANSSICILNDIAHHTVVTEHIGTTMSNTAAIALRRSVKDKQPDSPT